MKFLSLTQISKSFWQGSTRVCVLDDLSFKFELRQNYAITGASGSGKSTLMHILAAVDQPDSGQVDWNDQFVVNKLDQLECERFWNNHIGLVFQQSGLIDELTVLENVALKGLIGNRSDAWQQAKNLLQALGLGHRLNFFPNLLSKGEQQRVSIARAMMCEPELILADEPTASLDQATGLQVIDLLIKLTQERGTTLIVSTHDEYVWDKMSLVLDLSLGKLHLKNK